MATLATMTTRALVLGGGGITGVAWEIGLITGLAEAGVDLAGADLIVGTSAGSAVAAQLTSGVPLADLYAAQLSPHSGEIPARLGPNILLRYAWAMLRTRQPERFRARIGALALGARTIPEADRKRAIAARVPVTTWPDRRLVITAVDAASGEFVTFDRDSGVDLVDAVAASCAVPGVWPPVTIGDRRYLDGGMRSTANADLADGHESVVIIAPIPAGTGPMVGADRQAAALRGAGARVALVSPDAAAKRAIGRNVLDPARRGPAARAGYAQATSVAETVARVWAVGP
jgi:NTE family protein